MGGLEGQKAGDLAGASSHVGTGLPAGWPILLGLTGIPAALQLLFLPFFPESPRYLLIQKKDEVAARNGKALLCWVRGRRPQRPGSGELGRPEPTPCSPPLALKRLRGWDDVGSEMEEIWQEDEAEKAAGFISVLKLFSMKSLRWQVISIIILMGGQQLSGVNAVRGQWGPGARRVAGGRCHRGGGGPCRRCCPEGPTSLWGYLPDLLLRRPDLPERGGERP